MGSGNGIYSGDGRLLRHPIVQRDLLRGRAIGGGHDRYPGLVHLYLVVIALAAMTSRDVGFAVEVRPRPAPPMDPPVELSADECAFKDALEQDPSFTTGTECCPQKDALAAWSAFVQRENVAVELQVFGYWRIGSLRAYNFDPAKGEGPNYDRAEVAFQRMMEVSPDLVSFETLNGRTVYATLPGPANVKAKRLAQSYRWARTLDRRAIETSCQRVNTAGWLVPEVLRLPAGRQAPASRIQMLDGFVADSLHVMEDRMAEIARYSDDAVLATYLLHEVGEIASPSLLATLQETARDKQDDALQAIMDSALDVVGINAGEGTSGAGNAESDVTVADQSRASAYTPGSDGPTGGLTPQQGAEAEQKGLGRSAAPWLLAACAVLGAAGYWVVRRSRRRCL